MTGSIACYKAVDLASKLVQAGALVDVIMSYGATQFVTPLAFRSITHRDVVTDTYDTGSHYSIEHVELARQADIVVVAPATVHCIAKLALGLADDPLTTTVVATEAPLAGGAGDGRQYVRQCGDAGESVQAAGAGRGHRRAGAGPSGVGADGDGAAAGDAGTAGVHLGDAGTGWGPVRADGGGERRGTQEPIDPVRVITNNSSGKMGYAVAEAARDRGARAILVTAPTGLPDPPLVKVVRVQTAQEMCDAVLSSMEGADALVMAAAVADYRPASEAEQKIKKSDDALTVELAPTTDILNAARGDFVRVGFSAESENLVANASEKVRRKSLDLIVANDITEEGSGFGSDTNRVVLIDRELRAEELPLLTKYEVGNRILDRVRGLWGFPNGRQIVLFGPLDTNRRGV